MKLFQPACLRFGRRQWARHPELALLDALLDKHPELIEMLAEDITQGEAHSTKGRQDMPSVEQVVRAALFKELKGLDYRELAEAQEDSRICELFVKLDERRPFSHQVMHKYIARIGAESLDGLLVAINEIAIAEGLEDLQKIRGDTTVVETNIHYPTNSALIWDCIRVCCQHLTKLKGQVEGLEVRDYRKSAKRNHFKISNAKSADKREALFKRQLSTFTACINQVDQVVRNPKKKACSAPARAIIQALEAYLPTFRRVYDVAYRKEILKQKVDNADKLVSIFEQHTDIISKGGREVQFGHKVSLCSGASNLIMDAQVLEGNPTDHSLLADDIARIKARYGLTPRDAAFDGGYATKDNLKVAQRAGITNIVFSKVKGSMQNVVSSKHMATRLKKWRNGIEANISNLKRGFDLRVCTWKGEAHFRAKFMWSVIGYNIRVMTRLVAAKMTPSG